MATFCDWDRFRIEDGVVKHHREGMEYRDRLMDGVDLDKSLKWDSEVMVKIIFLDEKEEIVGERNVVTDVDERHRDYEKGRGEKKFKRKRKIPIKNKKYPTKPKRWKKRLSKVANHIDLPHLFDEGYDYDVVADELNQKYWEEKEKKDKKIDDIMYSVWDRYRGVNNSWDFLYDSSESSSDEEVV